MPADTPAPGNDNYLIESDAIQRFFQRPFFLSLTIGLPFCIFKLLFGLAAMGFAPADPLISGFGLSVTIWSGWITRMTPLELYLWYLATTLNLVSLSLVSLYNEIRAVRSKT